MKKFQRIQLIISVVPFLSSLFVFVSTCVILKKHRSNILQWVYFGLIISISVLFVSFYNNVVMTGNNPVLNVIASGAILAISNCLCVKLQTNSAKEKQTDQPKTKIVFSAIGLAVTGLVAIGLLALLIPSANIDDINGDDISLATLTEEDILASYGAYTSSWSSTGLYGEHTNVSSVHDEYDYDKCSYETKKISGIKTVQITNVETDTLTLYIESTLESGNLEIFVTIDDILYEKIPVGKKHTVTLKGVANKDVAVRFGAESAKLSVVVVREYEGITNYSSKNHYWD